MPAESKKQRRLMGAAYNAKKKGETKPSYVPASVWSMSLSQLKDYATTSEKNLPTKKKKNGRLMAA